MLTRMRSYGPKRSFHSAVPAQAPYSLISTAMPSMIMVLMDLIFYGMFISIIPAIRCSLPIFMRPTRQRDTISASSVPVRQKQYGPDRTVTVGPDCLASVELDGSGSSDPDGDPPLISWTWSVEGEPHSASGVNPTIELPLGVHTITLVVANAIMSSAPDTIIITVIDSTSPSISVTASPDTLWPPNHKMMSVSLTVIVEDNCDAAPEVILISTASSEPDDDPSEGDGNTINDIQDADIGTADYEIALRAERKGAGIGRQYTVSYMAIDSSGNTATASATVAVPLNND